jgi:hypothetical protein
MIHGPGRASPEIDPDAAGTDPGPDGVIVRDPASVMGAV